MASRRSERQQEVYFHIMRLLQHNPSITTRDIARIVIFNGSAYYCVTALIDKGYMKIVNFSKSHNKIGYIYELTPVVLVKKQYLLLSFLKEKEMNIIN